MGVDLLQMALRVPAPGNGQCLEIRTTQSRKQCLACYYPIKQLKCLIPMPVQGLEFKLYVGRSVLVRVGACKILIIRRSISKAIQVGGFVLTIVWAWKRKTR